MQNIGPGIQYLKSTAVNSSKLQSADASQLGDCKLRNSTSDLNSKRTRFYSLNTEGEDVGDCHMRSRKSNLPPHHFMNFDLSNSKQRRLSECLSTGKPSSENGSIYDCHPQKILNDDIMGSKSCFRKHVKKLKKRVIFKLLPPSIESSANNLQSVKDDCSVMAKSLDVDSNSNILNNRKPFYLVSQKPKFIKSDSRKPPIRHRNGVSENTASECNLDESKSLSNVEFGVNRRESSTSLRTVTTDSNSKKLSDTSVVYFDKTNNISKSQCDSVLNIKITPRKKIIRFRRKSDQKKLYEITQNKIEDSENKNSIPKINDWNIRVQF